MAKGQKRAPPPPRPKQEKRPTRVWDKLSIPLPDRSIERDLRIILQRIAQTGGSELQSSQDTAAADSQQAPLSAHKSLLGGSGWVEPHTIGVEAGQQEHWRSRSSSPSFQFPPPPPQQQAATAAARPALLHPAKGATGPASKPLVGPTSLPTSSNSQGTILGAGGMGWGAYSRGVSAQYPAQAAFA